ncbi:hypothetical protein D3C73_1111810 [compost metagenome]
MVAVVFDKLEGAICYGRLLHELALVDIFRSHILQSGLRHCEQISADRILENTKCSWSLRFNSQRVVIHFCNTGNILGPFRQIAGIIKPFDHGIHVCISRSYFRISHQFKCENNIIRSNRAAIRPFSILVQINAKGLIVCRFDGICQHWLEGQILINFNQRQKHKSSNIRGYKTYR